MQQLPFQAFLPKSTWRPPNMATLPSWADAKRVAFDIESKDPQLKDLGIGVRRDGEMVGYSFSIEDGPKHYVPFRHEGGDNVEEWSALKYLRDQAERFTGVLVGGRLSYDLDYAAEEGAVFRKAEWIRDIQVAEPLLDEHRRTYGNDALADKYGVRGKDEDLLKEGAAAYGVHHKSELYKLPARFVGAYAERDAEMCHDIIRKQESRIEDAEMWPIYNLESKLLPILVKMRRRGVQVDLKRFEKMRAHLDKMRSSVCDEINRNVKIKIATTDLKNSQALGTMLAAEGVNVPRAPKGGYSIVKEWLANEPHPACKMLNNARSMATMISYSNSLEKYITPKGRVHPTFNQLKTDKEDQSDTKGTVTGRLSCNDPNEQQQPIRHPEMGAIWRGIYIPDYGDEGIWVSSDYSQQEPRLTVHYAEITGCKGGADAAQQYRENPLVDCHDMSAKITGLPRSDAKQIFLAVCYSMGGAKLCRQLGLDTAIKSLRDGRKILVAGPDGQAILDQFDERMPFVRQLNKMVEKKAKRRGEIRTLLGRVIHFPPDDYGNFDWTHKALNRLIQGGSADQMKKAMIDADAAGIRLQLQVHDEVDFSARSMEEAEKLAQIMRDAVPLRVPSRVDLECGRSWGEIDDKGRKQCQEFYN